MTSVQEIEARRAVGYHVGSFIAESVTNFHSYPGNPSRRIKSRIDEKVDGRNK